MLFLCCERVRAATDHYFCPLEPHLLEQRLEPGFELVVEVVQEYGAGGSNGCDICWRGLIQLAIAIGADNGADVEMIASHICEHVADDAECGDDGDAIGGPCRIRRKQSETRKYGATMMQHHVPPCARGAARCIPL